MPKTLQSALGGLKAYRQQRFDHFKVAVVVSTSNFDDEDAQTIEVQFSRGGHPVPVRIFENLGTNLPEEGDWVLVGFVDGSKHQPFLIGYLKDLYRTSDILRLTKNFFEVKFPIEYDPETHEKEFEHRMLLITHPADDEDETEEEIFLQIPSSVDEDHHTFFKMMDGTMDVATGNRTTFLSENEETEIKGEVNYHVHKTVTVLIDDDTTITIDGDKTVNISGDWMVNVDGDALITTAGDVVVEAGGNIIAQAGGNIVAEAGGNAEITAGGEAAITAATASIEAGIVTIEAGVVNVDGGIVNLAGGGPGVARIGDLVSVTVDGIPRIGTITSGSGSVFSA